MQYRDGFYHTPTRISLYLYMCPLILNPPPTSLPTLFQALLEKKNQI